MKVGTSGSDGKRLSPVTANARSLPAAICAAPASRRCPAPTGSGRRSCPGSSASRPCTARASCRAGANRSGTRSSVCRAGAVGAVADLAAVEPGPGDELLHRLRGHVLVDHQRRRPRRPASGTRSRAGCRRPSSRTCAACTRPAWCASAAACSGRGARHGLRGEHARGAGAVVDDHRLAERLAHLLGHRAANDVEHTARAAPAPAA